MAGSIVDLSIGFSLAQVINPTLNTQSTALAQVYSLVATMTFLATGAAEMMIRSTARFSRLVLADPLGIKVSGREQRDIADMHGLSQEEYLRLAWADPAKGVVDYTNLPESEIAAVARGREAFALYGWKPYMHNPRLKRWLHRIDLPALVIWGEQDKLFPNAYAKVWQEQLPRADLPLPALHPEIAHALGAAPESAAAQLVRALAEHSKPAQGWRGQHESGALVDLAKYRQSR